MPLHAEDPRGACRPYSRLFQTIGSIRAVSRVAQAVRWPVPARYFSPRRIEQPWIYDRLGIRAFEQLMRSRLHRRINRTF